MLHTGLWIGLDAIHKLVFRHGKLASYTSHRGCDQMKFALAVTIPWLSHVAVADYHMVSVFANIFLGLMLFRMILRSIMICPKNLQFVNNQPFTIVFWLPEYDFNQIVAGLCEQDLHSSMLISKSLGHPPRKAIHIYLISKLNQSGMSFLQGGLMLQIYQSCNPVDLKMLASGWLVDASKAYGSSISQWNLKSSSNPWWQEAIFDGNNKPFCCPDFFRIQAIKKLSYDMSKVFSIIYINLCPKYNNF